MYCIMLTRVMCYDTTVCITRVVRIGLCVHSFGRRFLPMYESREVSTVSSAAYGTGFGLNTLVVKF